MKAYWRKKRTESGRTPYALHNGLGNHSNLQKAITTIDRQLSALQQKRDTLAQASVLIQEMQP